MAGWLRRLRDRLAREDTGTDSSTRHRIGGVLRAGPPASRQREHR
jgi:hypothetical protein